ncbi:unnamed protein product [Brassica rapa]|uniref:F-box domain-containing protein n=1 Tax=Brassica campestris TaxID=3711 RepID=A0A8D9D117_BRACM|nr:unnamed protein product [Brassica rapa]
MDHMVEEEILERLPVKSLCRFKSVSKQWKSMIESSYLAKKRLVRFPDLVLFLLKSEKFKDDQSSKTIFLKPYGVEEKLQFVLTNFRIDIVNFITIIELELWGIAMGWLASIILDTYI